MILNTGKCSQLLQKRVEHLNNFKLKSGKVAYICLELGSVIDRVRRIEERLKNL